MKMRNGETLVDDCGNLSALGQRDVREEEEEEKYYPVIIRSSVSIFFIYSSKY